MSVWFISQIENCLWNCIKIKFLKIVSTGFVELLENKCQKPIFKIASKGKLWFNKT